MVERMGSSQEQEGPDQDLIFKTADGVGVIGVESLPVEDVQDLLVRSMLHLAVAEKKEGTTVFDAPETHRILEANLMKSRGQAWRARAIGLAPAYQEWARRKAGEAAAQTPVAATETVRPPSAELLKAFRVLRDEWEKLLDGELELQNELGVSGSSSRLGRSAGETFSPALNEIPLDITDPAEVEGLMENLTSANIGERRRWLLMAIKDTKQRMRSLVLEVIKTHPHREDRLREKLMRLGAIESLKEQL